MNFPRFLPFRPARLTALCLLLLPAAALADSDFEDAPVGFDSNMNFERAPWAEGAMELPAWPGEERDLLRLNVSTEGLPYTIYLDPASLTTGADRVVRYTVVMVSSTGIRNVTYEGLHCGERNYRRFAYGIDGAWQPVRDSTWQRITGHGLNRYRKLLYEDYLCDTSRGYQDAAELVRRLSRVATDPVIIED